MTATVIKNNRLVNLSNISASIHIGKSGLKSIKKKIIAKDAKMILEMNSINLRSRTTNFSSLKRLNKSKAFKIDAIENANARPI